MRAGIFFAVAGALCAQSAPDPTDVLAHARDRLVDRSERLPNYTCVQTVNRKYFRRPKQAQPVPACSEVELGVRPAYPLQLYMADRLRLDVKVSRGNEIGSWAGASQFDSKSIFDLVGGGPFGTGALGTFLSDIFTGGAARFEFDGERPVDDATLYQYGFRVPLSASHYLVHAGHDWQPVAYDGMVRIDPHSFDLRHLLVHTSELPFEAETCEAATNVDYERVRMSTGDFLLPQQSQLHIIMTANYETDTTTTYSGCREYHGEATIRFGDEPPATATGQKTKTADPLTIPAGLPVSLTLTAPIDTDIAAAGDLVVEKVRKPVRAHGSDKVLIPAGAAVRARIIRMQHWMDSPDRFDIAIRLETWEADGIALPLFAKPDREEILQRAGAPRQGKPIILPAAGQPVTVATFVFTASRGRYVVPRGFQSNWITIVAPAKP
ncbi:MAG: hypothetical protein LAP39_00220 [Acidobacteriia bacterium]|nr:hypothetical protein [Terriglobia bacterium]